VAVIHQAGFRRRHNDRQGRRCHSFTTTIVMRTTVANIAQRWRQSPGRCHYSASVFIKPVSSGQSTVPSRWTSCDRDRVKESFGIGYPSPLRSTMLPSIAKPWLSPLSGCCWTIMEFLIFASTAKLPQSTWTVLPRSAVPRYPLAQSGRLLGRFLGPSRRFKPSGCLVPQPIFLIMSGQKDRGVYPAQLISRSIFDHLCSRIPRRLTFLTKKGDRHSMDR
jgi:hypothetical protein